MKVIVCGGRDFQSPAQVWRRLDEIHTETPITQLMQGGAGGVDAFAREWAITQSIRHYVCHADWKTHGKAAGPIRNKRMLEWNPDLVIAFPGGHGTANMVKQAREAGITVKEVNMTDFSKLSAMELEEGIKRASQGGGHQLAGALREIDRLRGLCRKIVDIVNTEDTGAIDACHHLLDRVEDIAQDYFVP